MRKILLYLAYTAIVAALIVAISLSFSTKTAAPGPVKSVPPARSVKPAPPPAASSMPSNPGPSTQASNQGSENQNQQLTNSGPGDVIGLFAAVSILSGLLHWRWQAHKLY